MVEEVAGPTATEEGGADDEIQRLAAPVPGERSWEAVTRKRALYRLLEAELKRDMPPAARDAKKAEVSVPELAEQWGVTAAWIYTIAPARKRGTGK